MLNPDTRRDLQTVISEHVDDQWYQVERLAKVASMLQRMCKSNEHKAMLVEQVENCQAAMDEMSLRVLARMLAIAGVVPLDLWPMMDKEPASERQMAALNRVRQRLGREPVTLKVSRSQAKSWLQELAEDERELHRRTACKA